MTSYKAHGKCLLAGEYAVLHQGVAVVCPVKEATVSLEIPHHRPGIWVETATSPGPYPFPDQALVQDFLAKRGVGIPEGVLIKVDMPLQAGLGSSAAIASVVAKAFHGEAGEDLFQMAWSLESLFHGTSSGADVAGALSKAPLVYRKDPLEQRPLRPAWTPILVLSSAGTQGASRPAVEGFWRLRETNPRVWEETNHQMNQAALDVAHGLENVGGGALLKDALIRARKCFEAWGAISPEMQQHMETLMSLGAVAVKPTGSGGGGMVLSLWEDLPHNLPFSFFKVTL